MGLGEVGVEAGQAMEYCPAITKIAVGSEKGEEGRKKGEQRRRRKKTHPMSLGGTPTTLDMTYFPRMGKPNF